MIPSSLREAELAAVLSQSLCPDDVPADVIDSPTNTEADSQLLELHTSTHDKTVLGQRDQSAFAAVLLVATVFFLVQLELLTCVGRF